ncbi:MAG: helix-turn-helix domain-containing protein [Methanolinea sp.]|jgi:predicted transcriptional regulator|nr:helix-turn-helix domain-containing protein [Methanolinea sp.]
MKGHDCDIMFCDTMARRILPCLRAEMVCRLVQKRGISQSDAARRLGVSRAAVSQYMNRKRGDTSFELSPDLDILLDRWAEAVAGNGGTITLCDLCRCTRKRFPDLH